MDLKFIYLMKNYKRKFLIKFMKETTYEFSLVLRQFQNTLNLYKNLRKTKFMKERNKLLIHYTIQ